VVYFQMYSPVLTAHHNKMTISGFQLGLLGFDLFWTSSVLMSFPAVVFLLAIALQISCFRFGS